MDKLFLSDDDLMKMNEELREQIYQLKWALHIEVDGDHSEECDCKDHSENARKLLGDFRCPGIHCQGDK